MIPKHEAHRLIKTLSQNKAFEVIMLTCQFKKIFSLALSIMAPLQQKVNMVFPSCLKN